MASIGRIARFINRRRYPVSRIARGAYGAASSADIRGAATAARNSFVAGSAREAGPATRVFNGMGKAGGFVSRRSRLIVPALVGTFLYGGAVGYQKELLNDPTTSAMVTEWMQPYVNTSDPRYYPLGYSKQDLYYRAANNQNFLATGELALAMFKTRHGR